MPKNSRPMSFKARLLSRRLNRRYGLPSIALDELAAGEPELAVDLRNWNKDTGAGNLFDTFTLAVVAKVLKPKRVFEIGTGDGRAASVFSGNSPEDARVFTLDPDFPDNPVKGSVFHGQPEAAKIAQLTGRSDTFDFSEYNGSVDLVYVDGGHEYEDVVHDCGVAERLLGDRGWILWDDFSIAFPGVMRALHEWGGSRGARVIAGTDIVVYRKEA